MTKNYDVIIHNNYVIIHRGRRANSTRKCGSQRFTSLVASGMQHVIILYIIKHFKISKKKRFFFALDFQLLCGMPLHPCSLNVGCP